MERHFSFCSTDRVVAVVVVVLSSMVGLFKTSILCDQISIEVEQGNERMEKIIITNIITKAKD